MGFLEGFFGGKKDDNNEVTKEANPGGKYVAVPGPDSPASMAEADLEAVDPEKEITFLQTKIEDIKSARESGRDHPEGDRLSFYETKLTNLIESQARNSKLL